MRVSVRTTPHLRLTAAILVAMLAALAGTADGDSLERSRRAELQTLIGGLRLVSIPDDAPARVHLAAAIRATSARSVADPTNDDAGDRAELRASRRERLDASRASGAALLRTTALPPPIA
jgi:hypothetical protein